MDLDLGIAGKVAIVTGGSRGIGRACATELAREGARVAICARNLDALQQAAAEIKQATGSEGARIRQFVLGIISVGAGIPITIVPMVAADNGLPAVVIAWLGIVGVNAAHAAAVNGNRRD